MISADDDEPNVRPGNIAFDESNLESCFREHFIPLCTFCSYRFGFDVHQAKETVHTAFIRLWEHRKSIASHGSVKGYLY
ncbi:MAG: hypothetical protein ABI151_06720, partial [Chitinophagaceae bacterium]